MISSQDKKFEALIDNNRKLREDLRKTNAKLVRRDRKIKTLLKNQNRHDLEIIEAETTLNFLADRIQSKRTELKEIEKDHADFLSLGYMGREQRIKEMDLKLLNLSIEIKEREAKLAEIDSKARRLRELEDTIDMMAENIVKRTAALCHTLDELASFHSRTLDPNP